MRNSGFVTDSDTERELRKWQQARDMPIDVEKIRQQYRRSACRSAHDFFHKDTDTDSLEKDTGGRG